jgi:hypothetical protein
MCPKNLFGSALLRCLTDSVGQGRHLNSRASHPDALATSVEHRASRIKAKIKALT